MFFFPLLLLKKCIPLWEDVNSQPPAAIMGWEKPPLQPILLTAPHLLPWLMLSQHPERCQMPLPRPLLAVLIHQSQQSFSGFLGCNFSAWPNAPL